MSVSVPHPAVPTGAPAAEAWGQPELRHERPHSCVSSGTDFHVGENSLRAPAYLHLVLDPGPDGVGLGGKLAPQALIGVLAGQLLLQGLVPDGHELLHLSGPRATGVRGQLWSSGGDQRME